MRLGVNRAFEQHCSSAQGWIVVHFKEFEKMSFDAFTRRGALAERPSVHRASSGNPVLVTGMHRSGTSWLGRMLCAGGDFIYVPEPLSPLNRQTILKARVSRWFTYISDESESCFLDYYRDAVSFKTHPLNDIQKARLASPRDPVRIPKRWASFLLGRGQGRRVLFRDPFAVFSIEWFARRLNCQVVVIVRHPLAVVSSLKRLAFNFDFRNLLDQPALMNERLEHLRPDMEALVDSSDVIAQGSLLWRIVYGSVASEREQNSSLYVVRHEDLSLRPIEEYERLYDILGLSFSAKARGTIDRYVSDGRRGEVSARSPYKVRPLNSSANVKNWRHRLNAEEVERIMTATRSVAEDFYSPGEEHDWHIGGHVRGTS
jgi:hypothetical protein